VALIDIAIAIKRWTWCNDAWITT